MHARDCNGYTALHHATSHHAQLDLARTLLKHGADPNARNRFGNNTLMDPVMLNNFEACKLLFDAGADPDLEDFEGFTPRKIGMAYPAITALFARRRDGRNGGESSGSASVAGEDSEASQAGAAAGKMEDELGKVWCSSCEKKLTPKETKRCGRCHVRPYCSKGENVDTRPFETDPCGSSYVFTLVRLDLYGKVRSQVTPIVCCYRKRKGKDYPWTWRQE